MNLLSNGSVLIQDGDTTAGAQSQNVFTLSPQGDTGSFVNGVWAATGGLNNPRRFSTSAVLPDGRVFVIGGEYPSDGNTAEIYNPATGVWTLQDPFPKAKFGDDPIEVLSPDATHPDGQILCGYLSGPQTYLFNPTAPAGSQWTATGTKLYNDQSDEESWVKLPDGSILSYDVFSSMNGMFQAQRYVPSMNQWVDASNLDPTNKPSILSDKQGTSGPPFTGEGSELGPGFLLPNGNVIIFGANGNTAYYNPTTNLWSAGPKEPIQFLSTTQMVATDDPAAMLPNGDILICAVPPGQR